MSQKSRHSDRQPVMTFNNDPTPNHGTHCLEQLPLQSPRVYRRTAPVHRAGGHNGL